MRIPGSVSGTGDDNDFVARCPGDRDKSVGVDLTVIATMAAKYLTPALAGSRARNTTPSPFAPTSKAETSKHSKYDRPVASMNPPLKFVAIAFNDYGGIGFEFYSAVVKPYFEGLHEKEEEAGGSGWNARKQKSEFLQRVSITIAKGNSRVLDCMRHDRQSSTAPDLVFFFESSFITHSTGDKARFGPEAAALRARDQTWSLALCTTHARWPPLVT
jgi:hypothetical protein